MQLRIEQLIKELSKKYNKPPYVIEEIFLSQFKFMRKCVTSLEFKTIKLPNWGKYIPSKEKLSKIDYTDRKERNELRYGKQNTKSDKSDTLQGS